MGYKRPRHSNVVLNLTPLIDIVFLLLVFFMLTAHFIEDQALVVDLPDANHAPAASEHKEIVTVIIGSEGEILINNHLAPDDELVEHLRNALDNSEERIVRIRGDNEAHLGVAVKVLDAAEAAGAKAVDILTEKP
ncbi:MAG: biopolymer transporter ExbD [Pseudomonadota bacterium]